MDGWFRALQFRMRDFPSLKRGVQEFQKGKSMINSQSTWDDFATVIRLLSRGGGRYVCVYVCERIVILVGYACDLGI